MVLISLYGETYTSSAKLSLINPWIPEHQHV